LQSLHSHSKTHLRTRYLSRAVKITAIRFSAKMRAGYSLKPKRISMRRGGGYVVGRLLPNSQASWVLRGVLVLRVCTVRDCTAEFASAFKRPVCRCDHR